MLSTAFAYFPYSENIKVGLGDDHIAVCVSHLTSFKYLLSVIPTL
jgi:hypothetical protein